MEEGFKFSTMELYAGLDVHSESTSGRLVDKEGHCVQELQVKTDEEGFEDLFGRFKNAHITAVFEAGRNWTHVARLLRKWCKRVVMAHPLRVRAIASARIKTDKIDAKILADLLRADLIPEAYMPDSEILDLRTFIRYRAQLGRISSQLKNRVHAILAREGRRCAFDPCGPRARLWRTHLDLNPVNRRELDYLIGLIEQVKQEIKSVNTSIEGLRLRYPDTDLLRSIYGIGSYSALMILAEIGDIRRFSSPAQLAAYSGLVSSTRQTGQTCWQGRITKTGNRWLRWILVECALVHIRKPSRLTRFYRRLARKKGHQRALVATARKMLTIIWHLLQKRQTFVP